jgi:hypothetical protein
VSVSSSAGSGAHPLPFPAEPFTSSGRWYFRGLVRLFVTADPVKM